MKLLVKLSLFLAGVLLIMTFGGCGDTTRNDQGVSFTFIGWFDPENDGEMAVALAVDINSNTATNPMEYGIVLKAGLQNNMTGQGIRVQRIHHEYYIPGSSVQPPATSFSLSSLLGPAAGGGGEGDAAAGDASNSTLPTGFGEADTKAETMVVPPQVMEFINLNRDNLPEPPFSMIVSSYASGVTTSGKGIDSNEVEIEVLFGSNLSGGAGAADGGGAAAADGGAAAGAA